MFVYVYADVSRTPLASYHLILILIVLHLSRQNNRHLRDFNDFPWTKKTAAEKKSKGILWNANIERDIGRKDRLHLQSSMTEEDNKKGFIQIVRFILFVVELDRLQKNVDDSHKWQEWRDLNTGLILTIREEGEQECLTRRRTRGKGRIYNSNEIEIILWLQAYVCRYACEPSVWIITILNKISDEKTSICQERLVRNSP